MWSLTKCQRKLLTMLVFCYNLLYWIWFRMHWYWSFWCCLHSIVGFQFVQQQCISCFDFIFIRFLICFLLLNFELLSGSFILHIFEFVTSLHGLKNILTIEIFILTFVIFIVSFCSVVLVRILYFFFVLCLLSLFSTPMPNVLRISLATLDLLVPLSFHYFLLGFSPFLCVENSSEVSNKVI